MNSISYDNNNHDNDNSNNDNNTTGSHWALMQFLTSGSSNSQRYVTEHLMNAYDQVLEHPEYLPDWYTTAQTYLLPKNKDTENPKNYRPFACLTTSVQSAHIDFKRKKLHPYRKE